MEELIKKENDIFEILQKFIDANLEFIIVGVTLFLHLSTDFQLMQILL